MDKFFNALRSFPLQRSPNRWVGGVCGGIADKFGLDVTVVRLITLVLFLLPGVSIGAYLVAWLLLPNYDGTVALERILRK